VRPEVGSLPGMVRRPGRRSEPGVPTPPVPARPLRRDRRGRGLRGALAPHEVPLSRTRAERFDELVLDAVEALERRWREQLERVEFAVEDVPSLEGWDRDWVPLSRAFPAEGALPARVVVYRRPVESRATSSRERRTLVRDVVTEEVAELLGVEPDEIDPGYGEADPRD
jgi:predicted Zn-dependent protease with MMP-like domain